jgi:hypothetical protein
MMTGDFRLIAIIYSGYKLLRNFRLLLLPTPFTSIMGAHPMSDVAPALHLSPLMV